MDNAERTYLAGLARNCSAAGRRSVKPARAVRPNLRHVLDALTGLPAIVLNGHTDLVAANTLGRALFAPLYERADLPNRSRFVFLDAMPSGSGPTGTGLPATPSRSCTRGPLAGRTTNPWPP